MTLVPEDFEAFFREVHDRPPFPWQSRLLRQVAGSGRWPATLELPTGSGKTAAIDIAVFHLALEAEIGEARRAPVRIALVVDRRLVVDDAYERAQILARALAAPEGPVTERVAHRLSRLSGDGPPLIARRLRGGLPREGDWARTPSQPTVLCSTVDQIGSRLLFRGYGVSDSMKPVHAGLVGSDCLILLDEAHLAEPFRQTLDWVKLYRGQDWRESEHAAPWSVSLLTATPGTETEPDFALCDDDRSDPVLLRRLGAPKPARLVETSDAEREAVMAAEAMRAIAQWPAGSGAPAIGVVVNRVARARSVFQHLRESLGSDGADCLLLIGPARPVERDALAGRLAAIRTGAGRGLERPLVLVATQCVEAGVDIDLDALITEAAPLDALRQRFGRLNRAGREIVPHAAVVAAKTEIAARHDDPVYGKAIGATWERLTAAAAKEGRDRVVDFGLTAFDIPIEAVALSPRASAPVLLPAHVDLLSQTSPVPAADPDVALYLHGPDRQPDSITVVWRGDVEPDVDDDAPARFRRLLTLVPPRSTEAIALPLWVVRRWLTERSGDGADDALADAPGATPAGEEPSRRAGRQVIRWRGDDDRTQWIRPAALRPGDTIVAPADYGRVDEFGWNPGVESAAADVERQAALPFRGRRFAVRVAPGLLGATISDEALADALAASTSERWRDVRSALDGLPLPEEVREDLRALDDARKLGSVTVELDLYGVDPLGRPRGALFVAPFGLRTAAWRSDGESSATEDDAGGSTPGFAVALGEHSRHVEAKAAEFARAAGLPAERVADLALAASLHDAGKMDPRFQAWMHHGDPLGADPDDPGTVLAKSGRTLPRSARAAAGLPANWRHEALSVRLAACADRFAEASDPELVLWLVGTHHGYGRPFFPHRDPDDDRPRRLTSTAGLPPALPAGPGPQSLAFDWNGLDWSALFLRLKARYGPWGLAYMESVLRLADHRASEAEADQEAAR